MWGWSRTCVWNPAIFPGVGWLGPQEWVGLSFWKQYFLTRGHPSSHLATWGLVSQVPCVLAGPDYSAHGSLWNTDSQVLFLP